MSNAFPIPSRAVRRVAAPVLQPPALFSWHARFGSLNATTGHLATFPRASTTNTLDDTGALVPVGYQMPRWYKYPSWNGAPSLGLYCGTSDSVSWPQQFSLTTATMLCEFVNDGTAATPAAGFFYIGNDAFTGTRFAVFGGSNQISTELWIGANVAYRPYGVNIVGTASVQYLVQVSYDSGTNLSRIRVGGAVDGTPLAFGAWSTTISGAAAFPAGSGIRINQLGTSYGNGSSWFRRLSIYPGLLTLDEATARL